MTRATLKIQVSLGEAIDRLTILLIKCNKLTDAQDLEKVKYQARWLERTLEPLKAIIGNPDTWGAVVRRQVDLQNLNEKLWDLEDALRDEMANPRPRQKALARLAVDIAMTNDERAEVKSEINRLSGDNMLDDPKSYGKEE